MIGRICAMLGIRPRSPSQDDGYIYFDRGRTVPSDGALGYGTGCIWQKTNGAAGSSFYVNEGTARAADFNVSVGVLGALSVLTTMINTAAIATAKIAAGAVVGTKLAATGIASGSFTGHNNTGACTLTGATVGQRVLALFEIDTSSAATGVEASFESTITVADQIQQSSASNLSAKKYAVILLPVAA